MSFAWIENNDELRRVIEDGDFGAWRVFLHPEQRKYAERSYSGPFRLSGGAGTGKTVVLLHRARMLARREPAARVLLTTFTTNLADQLRTDLRRLDPAAGPGRPARRPRHRRVRASTRLASAVLRRAGTESPLTPKPSSGVGTQQVTGRTPNDAWQDALDAAGSELPPDPAQHGVPGRRVRPWSSCRTPVTTREAYYKVRRPGRGVALDRAKRAAVWDVIEAYRAQARIAGTIDFRRGCHRSPPPTCAAWETPRASIWPTTCSSTRARTSALRTGSSCARWPPSTPTTCSSPRTPTSASTASEPCSAVRHPHRRPVPAPHAELPDHRAEPRLRRRRAGRRRLRRPGGRGRDTAWIPSARSGPPPRLIPCATLTDELDQAAELVREWTDGTDAPETIAVLVREQRQRDLLVTGLAERGVTIRAVDREHIKPGQPVAMTMHRAKGTEFAKVLLFGVNKAAIPRPLRAEQYAEEAWTDAMLRERSLLYVAATRARDELALSWSGDPSQFLSGLP